MMLYLAVACQPGSGAPPRAADLSAVDTATQGEIRVVASTAIAASPTNPLAAVLTVETEAPAQVTARWDCGGRAGASSAQIDGAGTLEVWGVRAETGCDIGLEAVTAEGTERISGLRWTSGALPAALPRFEVERGAEAGPMSPGVTLVSTVWLEQTPECYAIGVDEEGEIVWVYLDTGGDPGGYRREHYVRDMGDGTLMLVLDRAVRRITPGGRTVDEVGSASMGLNHHDALPLPGGDALFLVSESRTVDVPAFGGPVLLQGDRLVRVADGAGGEPGDGEIVWEWSAFDHLDTQRFPGGLSLEESRSGLDWTHGNGLALAPDGKSVLYSARSQSWLTNISLETGEVAWILGDGGDFTLDTERAAGPAGGWFYNQHAPEMLADGSVLLYDNGNERPDSGAGPPLYSRAVRYALDTDAMTAAGIWGWVSPRFTIGMGDANLLPGGNVLVTNTRPPEGTAHIAEVDAAGREVWALYVSGAAVYRAERIGWPGG